MTVATKGDSATINPRSYIATHLTLMKGLKDSSSPIVEGTVGKFF